MARRSQHPLTPAAGLPISWRSAAGTEWRRWQFRQPVAAATAAALPAGPTAGVRSAKAARLEAAFFVADGPLSTRKLMQFALLADVSEVRDLIDELNTLYDADGSAFRIERVASGYQLLTQPQYAFWLDKLHQRQAELKLSSPALETLTIIAYRQPITRADVEAVRGVQCAEMIKYLMERGLVKIGGEDDSLGRPYLYITTRRFLELFGLRSLDDLPMADHLRRRDEPAPDVEEVPEGDVAVADSADRDPSADGAGEESGEAHDSAA